MIFPFSLISPAAVTVGSSGGSKPADRPMARIRLPASHRRIT
jgi:hypothetical protein